MVNYQRLWLALALFIAINLDKVSAQISPDRTLPENSQVVREDGFIFLEGGTIRETNLFHSFSKFSIKEAQTVILNNPGGLENVFLRVTGNSPSSIDGTLRSIGNANLFLMNRNGISFGPNATLQVGGDFIATTASGITFADGSKFLSLTQGDEKSLLSVSRPIGLEMFNGGGSIDVHNLGHRLGGFTNPFTPLTLEENPLGLSVSSGNSMILAGNDINFEGGILTAKSGQIQIWSVRSGFIPLIIDDLSHQTGFDGVLEWGNLRLQERSLLDVSSLSGQKTPGGNIFLYAGTIELNSASVVISQNESLEGGGGNISLLGTDSIVLKGVSLSESTVSSSLVISSTLGKGDSGEIDVETAELSILDGSRFGTRSYGIGDSGDIRIKAKSINLEGVSSLNPFLTSAITSNTLAEGSSGSLYIVSDSIKISGGAVIGSVTLSPGKGGNVNVRAESIFLAGNSPILAPSSISGTTFNQGKGGSVDIDAAKIYVQDGAAITTSSLGLGDGGDINIRARELVVGGFNDSVEGKVIISGISSSVIIPNGLEEDFFELDPITNQPSSGSIRIEAEKLLVDGGIISVGNAGFGLGGTIHLDADALVLKGGEVSALSFAGQGGNTSLEVGKLVLSDGALINASAGQQGNGGNVSLNAGIAILFDETEVRANAIFGEGGNIKISTDGFFASQESVVSASSQFGLDGNVEIDSDINNLRRVLVTPRLVIEPDGKVLQKSCEIKFLGGRIQSLSFREFPQSDNRFDYGEFISLTVIAMPLVMSPLSPDIELQSEENNGLPIQATTVATMPDGSLVLVNEARLVGRNLPQFPKRPDFCKGLP